MVALWSPTAGRPRDGYRTDQAQSVALKLILQLGQNDHHRLADLLAEGAIKLVERKWR